MTKHVAAVHPIVGPRSSTVVVKQEPGFFGKVQEQVEKPKLVQSSSMPRQSVTLHSFFGAASQSDANITDVKLLHVIYICRTA